MAYRRRTRLRGVGQFTAPTSRTGKQYIYDGRRVIIDDRSSSFKLVWNTPEIVEEIIDKFVEQLNQLSTAALAYMQQIVPVDTGRLRNTCYVAVFLEGTRVRVVIGAAAYYAVYVELGTRFKEAQPYIRPTFDYIVSNLGRMLSEISIKRGT